MRLYRFALIALLAAILAGCAGAAPASPLSPTGVLRDRDPASPKITNDFGEGGNVDSLSPTGVLRDPGLRPSPTPTPDVRRKPEDWRAWPVAPAPSARAREIYQLGLALGNDPAHFSKIGDCQSIREVLMGMFDKPGFYDLVPEHAYLDETIAAFAGSFDRDGQGVQGGFNAASLLSPLWANPEACQPGENPLACEYRIHRPSIVIISLEVWWDGRTPERYEQYMRRIIEYLIERGSLPILSTKADNVEGDHAINLATAKLAYEYDLPLWNWWRAAQELPNGGLDPSRPDGFHLDESAWTARSFTALEALDAVWRGVRAAGEGSVAAAAPPATPTAAVTRPAVSGTPAPATLASVTPAPWPDGARGALLLGLVGRQGDAESPLGVLRITLPGGERTQVAAPGYRLQAVSADATRLLASLGSELWLLPADGAGPGRRISAQLYPAANAAVWLPNGSIAYISEQDDKRAVHLDPLDGMGWRRLTGAADDPRALYPAPQNDRVYWGDAEGRAHYATLEGLGGALDESITRPQFAPLLPPNGVPALAFRRVKSEERSLLVLNRADGAREREAPLPGDLLLDFAWSPDGARISALLLNRSEYSGKWLSINHFVFTPADFGTLQMPKWSGLNPRSAWSADGSQILVLATQEGEQGGSALAGWMVSSSSPRWVEVSAALALHFDDFVWVEGLAWLPEP